MAKQQGNKRKGKLFDKSKSLKPFNKTGRKSISKPSSSKKSSTTADGIRLNKYISNSGICSRREADKLVDSGRIKVNNEIAILGTKITEGDKITIDNKLIKLKKKKDNFYSI